MSTALHLLILYALTIRQIHSETKNCHNLATCQCTLDSACILECTGWHGCDDAALTCYTGQTCDAVCGVDSESCDNADVYANGATALTVICDGFYSCRDTRIHCDTSDCSLTCAADEDNVCVGLTVNVIPTTYAFQCIGPTHANACGGSGIPAPFSPTGIPTTIPTMEPTVVSSNPTTSNPTTSEPTTAQPTTSSPTTNAPTTNSPTTTAPTTTAPTTNAPTSAQPTTDSPTTNSPTTNAPTTSAPTTSVPTSSVPTTTAPTTNSPTTNSPTTTAPTTNAPTTNAPTTSAPTAVPTTNAPTTNAPTTNAPTTNSPTTNAPTSVQPTTNSPTTNVPTTNAPTTNSPTTNAPTTNAPTSAEPTTNAPTTNSPTTNTPTTSVPTSNAPTTASPTTNMPTTNSPTTGIPTTGAPTTSSPTIRATNSGDETGDFTIVISADDISNLDSDEITKVVLQAIQDENVVLVSTTINGDSIVIQVKGDTDLDQDVIEKDIETALEDEFDDEFDVDIQDNQAANQKEDNIFSAEIVLILSVCAAVLLLCVCLLVFLLLRRTGKQNKRNRDGIGNMIIEEGNTSTQTGDIPPGTTSNGEIQRIKSVSTGEVEMMDFNENQDADMYATTGGQTIGDDENKHIMDESDEADDNDELYQNEKRIITPQGGNDDEMYDDLNRMKTPKGDSQNVDNNVENDTPFGDVETRGATKGADD